MPTVREDLQATLDARRDLGPEYEAALVESFADRLDATIAARVQAELHRQVPFSGRTRRTGPPLVSLALGSMGIGIPLTAIAATTTGLVGLAVTWIAIAVINVAAAMAYMRRP
ncbi:hypothetical protein HTZ77_15875 [Nonomuraea sp. SMC257]|uniref:Integral membrane protein n=1 Tax=Nonomuraea montanisoli TaxID=2741721 RepID=A0A7Y6I722_9ACTN|nr:hypothetical protein [Nonomuraea montanisoli]NUW32902.1 hypothetical protein [Nonomuraea montanisoli]